MMEMNGMLFIGFSGGKFTKMLVFLSVMLPIKKEGVWYEIFKMVNISFHCYFFKWLY